MTNPATPEPDRPGLFRRLTDRMTRGLQQLRYAEPATLRARWTMALAALAAAGVTLPGWVDARVSVAIAAFGIIAPWLQGKRTRADVWSQRTVDDLTELVRLFPGLADEARHYLGAGLSYRIVRGHLEGLEMDAARAATSVPVR